MINTVPSNEISDFIEYYSAACGPEMARNRMGATEDEIELFQKLAVTPIPNSYRGYLREFGRRDGRLEMGGERVYLIDGLIRYYQRRSMEGYNNVPSRSLVVAVPALMEGLCLSDPTESTPGKIEPQAMAFDRAGNLLFPVAESFTHYLYSVAFYRSKKRLSVGSSISAQYRGHDPERYKTLRNYSLQIGFEPYWFSDEHLLCLERGSEAILVHKRPYITFIFFYHQDVAVRKRLHDQFVSELELT